MRKKKQRKKPYVIAPEDRIPLLQKFAYAMGGLANDTQAAWLGQMVAILILGLGIEPYLVGLIGFVPRIFDAVLDPIIGYASDNARTRYGRRRPFIFWGAITAGILYALMFQLYKEHSNVFNGWYFLILQVIFFGAFTCYSIPWIALGYEMTPDYHERTTLQSWSRAFAQAAWLISPWCWAILYNKNWFHDPVSGAADPVLGARVVAIIIGAVIILGGVLPAIFIKERFADLPKPKKITGEFLKNLKSNKPKFIVKTFGVFCVVSFGFSFYVNWAKYSWYSLPLRVVLIILGAAVFTGVYLLLYAIPVIKKMFDNIALTFKIKTFVKICAVTFLIFNGFMLSSTFILWVIFFYVFKNAPSNELAYNAGGKLLGIYGTFSSICTVFVVSLIPWLSRKLGKKNAFFVTIPLSIVGYFLKWFGYNQVHPAKSQLWDLLSGASVGSFIKSCLLIVRDHYLLLACAPFIVFGLGSLFTIILSMVADVCDVDELATEERREGMFSAVYWWMVKLGLAVSGLLGGAMLSWTGFKQELGIKQSPHTLLWMRILDIGIPIVTSIIAIFIIMTFKTSEAKAREVRMKLERRREERRKEQRRVEEERRKGERRKGEGSAGRITP